jgi:xanthine dehydrogenase accessory factor
VDERLFAVLAAKLSGEPPATASGRATRGRTGEHVVLATVAQARGATPRKAGSRMLVGTHWSHGSVGGGAMEARVIEAARAVLRGEREARAVEIDLSGKPGAAGVCGGNMRVDLSEWREPDAARAIADTLARGERIEWNGETLRPDPRLLIVGGGHCGLALHAMAAMLDFERWVFDERAECFDGGAFAGGIQRWGDYAQLNDAFHSQREVYAVLLNRDFASDVATLRVLADKPLAYLGMMGSRKRIAEVRAALPGVDFPTLIAPIGLEIGAETPAEIAVSILAQVIAAGQVNIGK